MKINLASVIKKVQTSFPHEAIEEKRKIIEELSVIIDLYRLHIEKKSDSMERRK